VSGPRHVPGVLGRQMVEPKVSRGLGVEGGSPSDQPQGGPVGLHVGRDDIELAPLGLSDTIERQPSDAAFNLTSRGYTFLVLGICAVLVLLAVTQWAFGLTDDVREARDASASMIEKCRGVR
jgi:hypothetical protein